MRHTWLIHCVPVLTPNTISERSVLPTTVASYIQFVPFSRWKPNKSFRYFLPPKANSEESSCVFPPTYYCLNIYTSIGRYRGIVTRRKSTLPCALRRKANVGDAVCCLPSRQHTYVRQGWGAEVCARHSMGLTLSRSCLGTWLTLSCAASSMHMNAEVLQNAQLTAAAGFGYDRACRWQSLDKRRTLMWSLLHGQLVTS